MLVPTAYVCACVCEQLQERFFSIDTGAHVRLVPVVIKSVLLETLFRGVDMLTEVPDFYSKSVYVYAAVVVHRFPPVGTENGSGRPCRGLQLWVVRPISCKKLKHGVSCEFFPKVDTQLCKLAVRDRWVARFLDASKEEKQSGCPGLPLSTQYITM